MTTRRASQLTVGYSPQWKQQSAWDVPRPGSDLNKAFPATSRNYIDLDQTTEDINDCTGEDFLFELLTAEFARLNVDMDFDPDVFAGLAAGALGTASAPTNGVDEVQKEIITASGGTRTLTVQTEANAQTTGPLAFDANAATIETALEGLSNVGVGDIAVAEVTSANEVQGETISADAGTRTITFDGQTTAAIPYNASTGDIQSALELLTNVGPGDIVVSGSSPNFVYTFGGQYANMPVELMTVDDALLESGGGGPGSGSSAITQTTPGVIGGFTYTFETGLQKQDVPLIVVNPHNLSGGTSTMSVLVQGAGSLHEINRMTGYSLPLFTFYIGFRGSTQQPVIFKNVVVNSINVRSANRERVTASVELIGSADLEYAVGYVMPSCTDIIPLRFGDCTMEIGGTDYIASNLGREFEVAYQNDVVPQFDGAGQYSTRHERADIRPTTITMYVLGEPGDSLYEIAKTRATLEAAVRCGPAGRNVKFIAPASIIKLASTPIRFGGDPPESEISINARPKKVSGDSDTPIHVTANIKQTTVLLATV